MAEQAERKQAVIKIAYPEIDVGYLPLFVAKHSGFFDYRADPYMTGPGVDVKVQLVKTEGARGGIERLLRGEVEFTTTIGPALPAILAGEPLQLLAQMIGMPVFSLIVEPEINKVEDLKGKKIGVVFGGITFVLAYELFKRYGIDPDKDVEYVNLPSGTAKIPALQKRLVAAALFSSPSDFRAIEKGFKRLVFLGDVMPDLPVTGLIVRTKNSPSEDIVQHMVTVIAMAIARVHIDPGKAIEVMTRDTDKDGLGFDPDDARLTYHLLRRSFSPRLAEDGVRRMAEIVSSRLKFTREPGNYMNLRPLNKALEKLGLSF